MKKIRLDFVTNSSSTSYCLYGVFVDAKVFGIDENAEGFDCDNAYELMEKKVAELSALGVDVHAYEEGFEGAVGLDIKNMKETETLKQFKARAKNAVKKVVPGKADEVDLITEVFSQHY